jgi:DNA-binding transcriptional ArsR family regulator
LGAFFAALSAGDANASAEAVSTSPAWTRRELCVLAESCVPQLPPSVSPAGWLDGQSTVCPAEILGMCVPEVREGGEQSPLLLLLRPEQPVRRVLALGAPMMPGVRVPVSFEVKQGRAMATLAWLATEPDLERADLFERVYGFAYQSERHGGTLRVLLHRMRQGLPDGLRFEERLHVDQPALIPDPRVEFDQETLVLRHLAQHQGRASAREIAEALGVSSRTVQTVLRGMLDDGVCSSVRDGRRVEYRLEDTTLSEPTVSRLHPRGLTQLNEL